MPRKPAPARPDPARSRRTLPRNGVLADGERRRDRRDWLSVMQEGHPEARRPRKEGRS